MLYFDAIVDASNLYYAKCGPKLFLEQEKPLLYWSNIAAALIFRIKIVEVFTYPILEKFQSV